MVEHMLMLLKICMAGKVADLLRQNILDLAITLSDALLQTKEEALFSRTHQA
jgi:hypothetical protein